MAMTTHNRPHLIRALVENIRSVTPIPHRLIFCENDAESQAILDEMGVENFLIEGLTVVRRVNTLFDQTSEPYFYWGADDTHFTEGWLEPALELVKENQGVVAIHDGQYHFDTSILARTYVETQGTIDQPGLVMHPGYRHYFCEVEQYHTAWKRKKFAYSKHSVIEHRHWLMNGGGYPKDETYSLAESWFPDDRVTFRNRAPLWGGSVAHMGHPRVSGR